MDKIIDQLQTTQNIEYIYTIEKDLGDNINWVSIMAGNNILMLSIKYQYPNLLEIVKKLISLNIDVNTKNNYGNNKL